MDKLAGLVAKRFACGCANTEEASISRPGPMADEKEAVAPPGWEHTVKKMKKHDEIDNPWALAWSMKNKGDKPGGKSAGQDQQQDQGEDDSGPPQGFFPPPVPQSRFPETDPPQDTLGPVAALRVAARYQRAFEFSSPEALKKYLHDHPEADKSKHTVKKPEHHEPKPEEKPEGKEHGDEHGQHGEKKPKTSWKDLVKGLSAKAKAFVEKAPSEVKKFVEDEEHRFKALVTAHKSITEAPAKFVSKAWHHAKEEVHEFKTAGEGIRAWTKGQKMSHEQKHAFQKVAKHVAIATAAGALGAGLGAGAAGLAKGILGSFISSTAKKIAAKALTEHLEHLPAFEEVAHIGHHAIELFSEFMKLSADEADPDEVMQMMIAAAVAKTLKDLDPETIQSALEEAAGVDSEG